jgi:hypothetical protein
MVDVRKEFEAELARRKIAFSRDAESGRHAIAFGETRLLVNLENLVRDVSRDGDVGRIARFVDSIESSAAVDRNELDLSRIYWCLEPNDHVDKPDVRVALSDRVDRVLCMVSRDGGLITWVSAEMLAQAKLGEAEAGAQAFDNLAAALREAEISTNDIDGVKLGMLGSRLAFKAALILAPNAREILEPVLGWPLLAVAPDRDFLYLWNAGHAEFAGRVGGVVVREFQEAAYPVSTEVWRLDGDGVRAIGEFARPDK